MDWWSEYLKRVVIRANPAIGWCQECVNSQEVDLGVPEFAKARRAAYHFTVPPHH